MTPAGAPEPGAPARAGPAEAEAEAGTERPALGRNLGVPGRRRSLVVRRDDVRIDPPEGVAHGGDRPAGALQVLGAAIAGERIAGLGHRCKRLGPVVEHREQPADCSQPDRVREQVELAEGRLVLGQEVVERRSEGLGRLDHAGALPLHQLPEQLMQLSSARGAHLLAQAGEPGSPGRSGT